MFDPFNVAARFSAKYKLSESQEQVLRAFLAGLPDDVVGRFENRRRSTTTIQMHRAEILGRFTNFDRAHFYLVVWRNSRARTRELKLAAAVELERKKKRSA